jgi:NtrC-family two-component system response regulator AlgB
MPPRAKPESGQARRLVADGRGRAAGRTADGPEDILELAVPPSALDLVRRAASRHDPVLIRGEQGTWKGAVARAIHEQGVRSGGPFVEESARTVRDMEELLRDRAAQGGTLLVDEVGDLSRPLQESLLLRLQDGARTQGAPHAGVRFLATTSEDLAARARAGVFRRDLLQELARLEIELPPLRTRPQDILPLAQAFAERFARQRGVTPPTFSATARRLLVTWPWPGNVREAREVVERAMCDDPGAVLGADAFPEWMAVRACDAPMVGGPLTTQELEREHVTRVVAWASTVAEAARVLGIDPSTLRRKLRRWEGARLTPLAGAINTGA